MTDQLVQLEQQLTKYYQLSKKANLGREGQMRVEQVKTALKILRKRRQTNNATPNKGPIGSQIKQDPKEVAAANALIDQYANSNTDEDKFKEISKTEFVAALKQRIADPKGVDQDKLNLCGPAAFCVMWIEREPQSFAQAAIDLFQTGKAEYNGVKLKANKKMFKQDEVSDKPGKYHLQLVDWLMLSSLQNEKGLLGYNPEKEWGGLRGIGLPSRVLDWFEALSGGEAKKYRRDFERSALNTMYKEDHYILFLINVDLLNDYFSEYNYPKDGFMQKVANFFINITGNHYVVLNSSIELASDSDFMFDIWTWGRNVKVKAPEKIFNRAIVQTFVVEPE